MHSPQEQTVPSEPDPAHSEPAENRPNPGDPGPDVPPARPRVDPLSDLPGGPPPERGV